MILFHSFLILGVFGLNTKHVYQDLGNKMKVEGAAPPAADNQIVYKLSFLPNYCKATQNAKRRD